MKKNIIKVKKIQKPLICLLVIFAILFGIAVGKFMNTNADEINYEYESNNIGYDSTGNSLSATNVSDALDELYIKVGQCPKGKLCVELSDTYNSNIVSAYTYDENTCVTGNEADCIETSCYKALVSNACPVGTIVDYKVNDETTKRFHVLHDDGRSMTMQTQSNTVYNVAWWSESDDNTKGPQTIMAALKTATDSWTNVNPITITSGTTSFQGVDSIDNSCARDGEGNVTCLGNKYDIGLIAGTYRARLITVQEVTNQNVGQCKAYVSDNFQNNKSCLMFMNNFLYNSNDSWSCKNGKLCVNDDYTENGSGHNWGYWTMNARSSLYSWRVSHSGHVDGHVTSDIGYGARAVVVVDK